MKNGKDNQRIGLEEDRREEKPGKHKRNHKRKEVDRSYSEKRNMSTKRNTSVANGRKTKTVTKDNDARLDA